MMEAMNSRGARVKRVTAADVARALGLSRATVGFVLNNTPGQTIPEQTRRRVLAEAERLGYRPHTAARTLASGRSHIVLVVLPDWPIDYSLRRHLEEATLALDEAGYSLITYTPHPDGRARPLWEVLDPDVVLSLTGQFTDEQVQSLHRAQVRALLPDPGRGDIPPYNQDGPAVQLRHLHALGHRQIAFAEPADPRVADLVLARRERARSEAAALELPALERATIDLDGDDAAQALEEWRELGVTAVACYNDDVAGALVGAAVRSGVRVPEDLSVIGHDDAPIAAIIAPRLSTVRVDTVGLGRYLGQLVLSVAEHRDLPNPPTSTITLVERESCRDVSE